VRTEVCISIQVNRPHATLPRKKDARKNSIHLVSTTPEARIPSGARNPSINVIGSRLYFVSLSFSLASATLSISRALSLLIIKIHTLHKAGSVAVQKGFENWLQAEKTATTWEFMSQP
jgi:hypothetical protein